MASALYQSIELLSREKGIDAADRGRRRGRGDCSCHPQVLQDAGKHARRTEQGHGRNHCLCVQDGVTGDDELEDPVNQITLEEANDLAPGVEVGSEIRMYKDTTPLGRIAAQPAKQVIFQKVREAERDTVFQEYAHARREF